MLFFNPSTIKEQKKIKSKKENLDTVFPHIVSAETTFFAFGNPEVTVHKPKGHST